MLVQENQDVEDDDLEDFPPMISKIMQITSISENVSQPVGDVEGLFTQLLDALNVPEGLG